MGWEAFKESRRRDVTIFLSSTLYLKSHFAPIARIFILTLWLLLILHLGPKFEGVYVFN